MPLVLCIVGQYKKRTSLELADLRGEAFLSVWISICKERDESQTIFHLHGDLAKVCRKNQKRTHSHRGPTHYTFQPNDLEVYFSVCKDNRERRIIDLLSKGYRQTDIASELDCSPATVNVIVESLRERYYEHPAISVANVNQEVL